MKEQHEAYALAAIGATQGVYRYYIKPELRSGRAWATIAFGVCLYELAAPENELLSHGYDRALQKHRLATVAGTLLVTGHLLNAIPERYDPIHQLTKLRKL